MDFPMLKYNCPPKKNTEGIFMTKRAKFIVALVLVLTLALMLTACNGGLQDEIDKLKQEIEDLQQQVGGYEADFEEKNIVIYIGEKRFDVTTRKAYLHDAIKDLLKEQKISKYEYGADELNPYISAIDELQQDTANYKYYSVWHNVDVFALKSAPSEWGNPGRATIEADDFGSQYVVTTVDGTKLYYSSTGVGTLPLVDGCTYAVLVD